MYAAKSARIAPSAHIEGPCIICEHAEIRHCAFVRGSAIIGAVADGVFASFEDAADKCISFTTRYEPVNHAKYESKFAKFCALYEAMLQVTRM